MEEIKIYHSSWLYYLVLIFFLIVLCTIPTSTIEEGTLVVAYLMWMASLLLEMLFLYRVVRSKIFKIPAIIITDEYVKVDISMRKSVTKFCDVHSFELIMTGEYSYIGVNFNVGVKSWKDKKMNDFVWWCKSFNYGGYDQAIPVSKLSLKEEAILDILNEKLENYRKKE